MQKKYIIQAYQTIQSEVITTSKRSKVVPTFLHAINWCHQLHSSNHKLRKNEEKKPQPLKLDTLAQSLPLSRLTPHPLFFTYTKLYTSLISLAFSIPSLLPSLTF
jgi:hypothetical protein